jgi:2-keto-4-pentenoate hydratase
MFILKSIIIIWLALTTALSAGEIELSEKLWQSYHNHQRIPLISASKANLSIEQAYLVQTHYVKKRLADGKPAGFKAGLTSFAVQKKFKVNQALAGVLFADGDLSRANSIQLSQFKRLMLETEIGFEVGTAITSSLKNPDELKRHIRAVFPVIELPDLGFANKPKGIDIIAANVGAAAFIKGKAITTEMDLNALTVTLTKKRENRQYRRRKGCVGEPMENGFVVGEYANRKWVDIGSWTIFYDGRIGSNDSLSGRKLSSRFREIRTHFIFSCSLNHFKVAWSPKLQLWGAFGLQFFTL